MQSNQNCTAFKCDRHGFSLKALHKDKRPYLNTGGIMCRRKQIRNKKNMCHCKNYEGAMFNKDYCHATPAFILPSEKKDYLQSTREFLRDHQNKVKEYQQQPNDLYIAKPRSKSMYCSVCRETYQQYVDHIKGFHHRNNARSSTFNNYILELEGEFKLKNTKEPRLSSAEISNRISNEEEAQCSGITGRKQIKINSETAINISPNPQVQSREDINFIPAHMFLLPQFQHSLESFKGLGNYKDLLNPYRPEYTWNSFYGQMQPMIGSNYSMFCIPFQQMMPVNAQYHPFQQQFW